MWPVCVADVRALGYIARDERGGGDVGVDSPLAVKGPCMWWCGPASGRRAGQRQDAAARGARARQEGRGAVEPQKMYGNMGCSKRAKTSKGSQM